MPILTKHLPHSLPPLLSCFFWKLPFHNIIIISQAFIFNFHFSANFMVHLIVRLACGSQQYLHFFFCNFFIFIPFTSFFVSGMKIGLVCHLFLMTFFASIVSGLWKVCGFWLIIETYLAPLAVMSIIFLLRCMFWKANLNF